MADSGVEGSEKHDDEVDKLVCSSRLSLSFFFSVIIRNSLMFISPSCPLDRNATPVCMTHYAATAGGSIYLATAPDALPALSVAQLVSLPPSLSLLPASQTSC